MTSGSTVTVSCPVGSIALGGGGTSSNANLTDSYPSDASGSALANGVAVSRYWTAKFSNPASSFKPNTGFAICGS